MTILNKYLRLLHDNRQFRYLWLSQVVSLFGDWFNLIASATLISQLTEASGLAISGLFITRMLPPFLLGPFAGVVADRFNRRYILIVTDLLRAVLVCNFVLISLGLIQVNTTYQLGLIYVLTVIQLGISAFFEPAHAALMSNLVKPTDLLTANAIHSITWSVMIAIGSALGGLTTSWFGPTTAFVFDAVSFLISAWLVLQISPVNLIVATDKELPAAHGSGWQAFIAGLHYLWHSPAILVIALLKSAASLSFGGMDVVQVTLAEKHFPLGHDGSASLGLMYVAIGLGSGLGPLLAESKTGHHLPAMYRAILVGFILSTSGYFILSASSSLSLLLLGIFCRTLGTGINWSYSSALLQMNVPNQFLGRAVAFDLAMMTLAASASTLMTGWAQDVLAQSPYQISFILGSLSLFMTLMWLIYQTRFLKLAQ